jgi:hypothetical protein
MAAARPRREDGDLFTVINTSDASALRAGVSTLLSRNPGAVGEYWIEVLLACHLAGARLETPTSERFLSTVTEDQLAVLDGTLYEHFLPSLANDIVGMDVFEESCGPNLPLRVSFSARARALAFGICQKEWLPSYAECAREACYMMHCVEFVEAIHALCCLSVLHQDKADSAFHHQIGSFLTHARRYLVWSADAMNSSRLKWEIEVWDRISGAAIGAER